MKKTSLFISALCCFVGLYAQKDTTVHISEVTVSASRIQVPLSQAAHSISVVSADEIKNLPVQSLSGVLAYVGGVDVRQRGPMGSQADIGIRGGNFDQTLILIDGVKILDPQTGHHLMNLPINVEYVERIEVIRGGGAKIYGANAFGGAINIVTKKVQGKAATAKLFGGDFGFGGGSIDVAVGNQKTQQMLSAGYTTSSGYRPGNDFGNASALYKLSHTINNKLTFDFLASGAQRNMGAAGFYVTNSTEYEVTKTAFTYAKLSYAHKDLKVNSSLSWRFNDDHYIYIRLKPEVFQNQHHTHLFNADVQGTYTSKLGITGFGVDARQDEIYSNNLGIRKRNFYNLYLEHRFVVAGFVINPGLNVNYISTYNWQVFPGIDVSKRFLKNFTAYANTNKSYRVPTYNDLYYKGPQNIGNPNLQPEQAWNSEAGVKYGKGLWYAQAGVFRRESKNLIDWVKQYDTAAYQPQNFHNVIFTGIEAEITRRNIGPFYQVTLNYTGLQASYNLPPGYLSRYSLNYIKNQVQARVTVKCFKNLYISPAYRYVERLNIPAYHILDARVEYKLGKNSVFVDVNNVTNTNYVEAGYVPMPGRWIWGGVKINLL
jgi:vitamin B12 transporter